MGLSDHHITKKEYASVFLILTAFALSILSMSSNHWFTNSDGNVYLEFGLKTYDENIPSQDYTHSGSLEDFMKQFPDYPYDLIAAGNIILFTCVPGVFLAVSAIGLTVYAMLTENGRRFRQYSVLLSFLSGLLLMLGVVMYAKKVYLDWAFILLNFCAFLILAAATLQVAGLAETKGEGDESWRAALQAPLNQ